MLIRGLCVLACGALLLAGCVQDSGPAGELFEQARDPLAHRYLNGLLC